MGLYCIPCWSCGQPFWWFSGNMDQRCRECVERVAQQLLNLRWACMVRLYEARVE